MPIVFPLAPVQIYGYKYASPFGHGRGRMELNYFRRLCVLFSSRDTSIVSRPLCRARASPFIKVALKVMRCLLVCPGVDWVRSC